MTYTIYGQNKDKPIYSIATISTETKKSEKNIIDMLFDYKEWSKYASIFENIWAEEKGEE